MSLIPGDEVLAGVPASERFNLTQGREPIAPAQPAPAAAPAAPAAEAPIIPAEPQPSQLDQLNSNLLALIDKIAPTGEADAEARRAAAAAPDPVAALLEHPDPEIRQLAEIVKQQRDVIQRIESRQQTEEARARETAAERFERELLAQVETAKQAYRLSDAETDAVMKKWEAEVNRDPRLAILTFDEVLRRVADPQALEARRAGMRPPARGEAIVPNPPVPQTPPRAPVLVTDTAAGGGREARVTPNGSMSNANVSALVLKERFGLG